MKKITILFFMIFLVSGCQHWTIYHGGDSRNKAIPPGCFAPPVRTEYCLLKIQDDLGVVKVRSLEIDGYTFKATNNHWYRLPLFDRIEYKALTVECFDKNGRSLRTKATLPLRAVRPQRFRLR